MSSHKADVRLGAELLSRVQAFKAEGNIETMSAAIRALVQLGLEQTGQMDVAWRRIAWQEGVIRGRAELKNAFAKALNEIEGAL